MQNRWANFDEVRNCWKIDIKFGTYGFSKLMLNLLIRSVAWTEQDYQPDREVVKELRKALEESKLDRGDASGGDENKWIRLFLSAEITLSKRSKGQHLNYTEKLHIMNMYKHQGLQKRDLSTLQNKPQNIEKDSNCIYVLDPTEVFRMKKDTLKTTTFKVSGRTSWPFCKSIPIVGDSERCPDLSFKI